MKLFAILCLLQIVECIYCYKILVTAVSLSSSHNLIMYRLAEILGKRGHDVTILKKEMIKEAKTPKLIYSSEIVHELTNDTQVLDQLHEHMNSMSWNGSEFNMKMMKGFNTVFKTLSDDCERLLKNEEFMNKIKARNFDVIIIHIVDFCSFGMAEALGIKGTIWMSSAFMSEVMAWYSGSPSLPSYVVSSMQSSTDRMNFLERMKNFMMTVFMHEITQFQFMWTYDEIFHNQYGKDFPSLGDLFYKTQLYFINSDPFFEYPRPTLHNVIYVGGLTMKSAEPLSKEWEDIVNNSGDHGVVVFSLGSVANTAFMPIEMKKAFINAFKKISQTVIWRLEGDTSEAEKVPNIIVSNWLPQKDLLGHPKVKAFITHGGYNSLTEATYLGVPLVMFPLFADQHANVKRVERLQVGVTLPRENLTEYSVLDALNAVLNNEEIQQNARRLGRMIRNKPESSEDLAVKWVEYLAEFQNLDQLKPASHNLNFVQYFLLDVIFTVFLAFLLLSIIYLKCCLFFARYFCRGGRKQKKE